MAAENGFVDSGYYENERQEVASLVDDNAMVVLDVGCGKGTLGSLLKRKVNGRKVYGIEYVPSAAAVAATVLDTVVTGDVMTVELPFAPASIDCMIFADVLEHLTDPQAALMRLKPFLKPGGMIVSSIPNMRHYTVIIRLLRRGWEYDDFGHFDRTHFRFFSLSSMRQLFADSGFVVEFQQPRLVASKKMMLVNSILGGKLDEFAAFQYLFRAKPR